ncbi:MAG: iron ABC transporter permease [Opitutaceae bacterium]|nr:iron ABC transporter permease [Opitutaceae bacterium]
MSGSNKTSTMFVEGRYVLSFAVLAFVTLIVLVASVCLGSALIPFREVVGSLFGAGEIDPVISGIVLDFRLPRALTALLAGAALAASGLMMQTVFRNPLADPFVLGVNSGASLGVAVVLLLLAPSGVALTQNLQFSGHLLIVLAATGGAAAVLAVLLVLAQRVDVMSLLILGLMISYGIGSLVSILMFYSMAERLQSFFSWSFGNFGNMTWSQFRVFAPVVLLGLAALFPLFKILDAFLLGERYAKSMGVKVKSARILILGSASLLAGVVTGFCGPIGFLGIAAPHFCRFLFKTAEHRILVPASMLVGGLVALMADLIAKAPGLESTLPLNAVTALIGAPVIMAALLRQRNLRKVFG